MTLGQHRIWYLQIVMHSVMSLRLIGVITNLYIVLLITRIIIWKAQGVPQ